jgi:hypothetical protein
LQVFHLYVAKVDLDVSYTCMLQAYVLSVSYVCCKCFIWMLYTYAMTFKCFPGVLQVFQKYVASVSTVSDVCYKCFIWMLQKYVASVRCCTCCNGTTHLPRKIGGASSISLAHVATSNASALDRTLRR